MSRLGLLALLLACVLGVAACGGDDKSAGGAEATATASPEEQSASEATGCEKVEAPAPKKNADLAKPKESLKAGGSYVATVSTSCGDFKIALDAKRAPRTGGSFKYLADKGFFDGLTFHRIVPGFVIQGGDPNGDGTGGPGFTTVDAPPPETSYDKGLVAMAKAGNEPAGTSGSQFFVVSADGVQLDPDYAVLGRVTDGIDVVETIGELGNASDPSGAPTERVEIDKMELKSG
jgi:peptidyl-prolyl cis-trans isomerase B (cyclophilin B)